MLNITNMLDTSYAVSSLFVLVSAVVISEVISGRGWCCSLLNVSTLTSTTVVIVASLNKAWGMTFWISDNFTIAP